ncbi:MAG: hypothetical protein Q7T54_06400 [Candidatus Levybacteria bacterium]|nr:hypothetical protein [Candidatus Levybacteria bacterium]
MASNESSAYTFGKSVKRGLFVLSTVGSGIVAGSLMMAVGEDTPSDSNISTEFESSDAPSCVLIADIETRLVQRFSPLESLFVASNSPSEDVSCLRIKINGTGSIKSVEPKNQTKPTPEKFGHGYMGPTGKNARE